MFTRMLLGAMFALILGACSSDPATAPAAPLPSTVLIADPGVIRDGDVVQLSATVRSSTGATVPNASVLWTVTDPTVATITSTGVLTALREGSTDVIAYASGTAVQQRRAVAIVLHPATAIELNRTQLDLPIGQVGGATVTLRGLDGRVLLNRSVEWSSSDPSIVRVASNGLLTPLKGGTAVVTVRYGSLSATLQVRVPAPNPTAVDYRVTTVDGLALAATIDDRLDEFPDGSIKRVVTRIEEGSVALSGSSNYQLELKLAAYEYSELGGNVILRLISRTTLRDVGTIEYNFLTQDAYLISTRYAGLTHLLDVQGNDTTLTYREPGTNNRWTLGLAMKTP